MAATARPYSEAQSDPVDVSLARLRNDVWDAEDELRAARRSGNQDKVAAAKVAVAEAKVAVAKGEDQKDTAKGILARAICGLELAQAAYGRALHPDSVGAARHPGAEAGSTRLDDVALALKSIAEQQQHMRTTLHGIDEQQQHLTEQQQHMRTTLHVMNEAIRYVHETLTPTEARTAKSLQYKQLLEKMQLKVRTMRTDEVSSIGEPPDHWLQFSFVWSKELDSIAEAAQSTGTEGSPEERETSPLPDSASDDGTSKSKKNDRQERQCYEPVRAYVADMFPTLDVRVVAEGQELDHGLLFSEKAFTSRQLKPDTHRGQDVVHITNIHGRTDIAAFDGRGCQRSNVKFAIEMKTQNAMKNAEREAITQLLGLNIRNPYYSPPVVLSNAVQTHRVFFVEELDAFPFFGIVQGDFDSLRHALWMVAYLLSKPGCTTHLGRGPTPPSSSQEV